MKTSNKHQNYQQDPCASEEIMKYKDPVPSREYILQTVKQAGKPLSKSEIMELLVVKPSHKKGFNFRLKAMVRDGQLFCNRRQMYGITDEMDQVEGRVIGHPDGFGYLETSHPRERYFLAHREMRKVLHGDIVLGFVMQKHKSHKNEVCISQVLQRNTLQIIGKIFREGDIAFVQSVNKRINQDVIVTNPPKTKADDLVTVKIHYQPTEKSLPVGEVIEVIPSNKKMALETDIAIRSYQIPFEWTSTQINQSNRFSQTVTREARSKELKKGRVDIRHIPLCTVDGEDSKDFDDAIYAEPHAQGWKLLVAIADVSQYVKPNDCLDKEAKNRGNSVYFANRVVPMLSENISNGVCSLNPNADRFCLCCEIIVNQQGQLVNYTFFEGLMRSAMRLTYKKLDHLHKSQNSKHWEDIDKSLQQPINNLHKLYTILKQSRKARGGIDIETQEVSIQLSKCGKIKKIKLSKRRRSHKIIEECMLLANICAAKFLIKHKQPFLYRVHGEPKADRISHLIELLNDLGIKHELKNSVSTQAFAKLLRKTRKSNMAHMISIAILRSFRQAAYSTENIGHFGLNYSEYTHFTSPIRRYSDLLVHRQIKRVLHKDTSTSVNQRELENLGEHLSFTERRADEATREVITTLKCEYAAHHQGKFFTGTISSVLPFGAFVDLEGIYIEGLLHISNLGRDYFHLDTIHHRLVGENSGKVYQLGDRLEVRLDSVDITEKRIELSLANGVNPTENDKPKKSKHSKKLNR